MKYKNWAVTVLLATLVIAFVYHDKIMQKKSSDDVMQAAAPAEPAFIEGFFFLGQNQDKKSEVILRLRYEIRHMDKEEKKDLIDTLLVCQKASEFSTNALLIKLSTDGCEELIKKYALSYSDKGSKQIQAALSSIPIQADLLSITASTYALQYQGGGL